MAAFSIGMLGGPPISGLLSEYTTYTAPFWLAFALCMTDALFLVLFLPNRVRDYRHQSRAGRHIELSDTTAAEDTTTAAEEENTISSAGVTDIQLDEKTPSEDTMVQTTTEPSSTQLPAEDGQIRENESVSMAISAQLRRFLTYPHTIPLLLCNLVFAAAMTAVELTLPIRLAENTQASPAQIGAVFFAANGALALCSVVAGFVAAKVGPLPVLFVGTAGFAVFTVMFSFVSSIALTAVIAVCCLNDSLGYAGACSLLHR